MKYHLFIYLEFYPNGGMRDYAGVFSNKKDIEKALENSEYKGLYDDYDIAILNEEGKLVEIPLDEIE